MRQLAKRAWAFSFVSYRQFIKGDSKYVILNTPEQLPLNTVSSMPPQNTAATV